MNDDQRKIRREFWDKKLPITRGELFWFIVGTIGGIAFCWPWIKL